MGVPATAAAVVSPVKGERRMWRKRSAATDALSIPAAPARSVLLFSFCSPPRPPPLLVPVREQERAQPRGRQAGMEWGAISVSQWECAVCVTVCARVPRAAFCTDRGMGGREDERCPLFTFVPFRQEWHRRAERDDRSRTGRYGSGRSRQASIPAALAAYLTFYGYNR